MKRDAATLEKIVHEADDKACLQFFMESSPHERAALAPLVAKLVIAAGESEKKSRAQIRSNGQMDSWKISHDRCSTLGICVLATGNLVQIKKLSGLFDPDFTDGLNNLLKLLQIPWLNEWLEHLMANRPWPNYVRVIYAGFVPLPPVLSDRYVHYLGYSDKYWDEPRFLNELVWRLFEIQDANFAGYPGLMSWLRKCSVEGKVPRGRLLDANLDALARDFPKKQGDGYFRFLAMLDPSIDEQVERLDHFTKLLASSIPPTVTVALEVLKEMAKAGRLPAERVILHLATPLLAKQKGTALKTVELLESIAKTDVGLRSSVLEIATEGLISDLVEVQERIARLLLKYRPEISNVCKNKLAELTQHLKPTVRKQVEPLLPIIQPVLLEAEADLAPIHFSSTFQEISSIDELIEKAAYVLENEEDYLEVERVLSGLMRFCEMDKSSFLRMTKPLLKRAKQILNKGRRPGGAIQIALCVHMWLEPVENTWTNPGDMLWENRIDAIAKLLKRGQTIPLISTPTNSRFFLDPRAFVDRVKKWTASGLEFEPYDLLIGFYRLAQDHRAEALAAANDLHGETGAAVRYALGGNETLGAADYLWVAASRARFGTETDELLEKTFPNLGPGCGRNPDITTKVVLRHPKHYEFTWVVKPPLKKVDDYLFLPNAFCACFRYHLAAYAPLWPAGRELLYLAGAMHASTLTTRLDDSEISLFKLTALMSDPEEKFGFFARWFLNLGLSGMQAEGRQAAIGAFVSGINSGRLDPILLGISIHEFFSTGLVYPPRLRKSLDEIVRVSAKHRRAVLNYLTEVFKGDPTEAPDQMVKLFELYHELLVEFSTPLTDPKTIAYLQAFPGGGRAAKLAKLCWLKSK